MKRVMLKVVSLLMIFAFVVCLISCDVEKFNKYNKNINLNVNIDEKIELNALFPNSGMDNSSFENGWTTKYFEKQTGYKVNYTQVIDNQTTVMNNILAVEDPYHVCKLESGTYMALVSTGGFVDLKPAL